MSDATTTPSHGTRPAATRAGRTDDDAAAKHDTYRSRYGLYVRCQNESINDLVRLMDIELTGTDTVSVRVFEDMQMKVDPEDLWDGSYRKMPQIAREPAAGADSGLSKPSIKLEGPYRSDSGLEISFAEPRYRLKTPDGPGESGGFELFALRGDNVLELVAIKKDGLPAGRKTYKASYSEAPSGKDLVRRLVLSPARSSIGGLELLREDDIVLEQRVKG